MTNKVNNDDRVFFPLQKEFSWIALYSRCNETENKRQLCMLLVAEPWDLCKLRKFTDNPALETKYF